MYWAWTTLSAVAAVDHVIGGSGHQHGGLSHGWLGSGATTSMSMRSPWSHMAVRRLIGLAGR